MANNEEKKSLMEKVSGFIVDKRKAFYLIYIVLIVFSVISSNWVKVNNNLADYLDEATETKQGLNVMDNEFVTYASANIMVDNISYEQAENLSKEIENVEGVKEIEFDDTDKHYVNASALFTVTFDYDDSDVRSQKSLETIRNNLDDYDVYISAELGNAKADRIADEVLEVMIIVSFIVVGGLLITSKTFMEVPVLIMTFVAAAIINKGTNFLFGTISFVSNSVAIVLQLALAIDYAIILGHRYTEERQTKNARDAVVMALTKAIPEIAGSCLTTLSGLAAMGFMHFKIGFDMSIILIKAIIISIITVFTLMPGLLMSFSSLIDKTHHKNFVPEINVWGRIVVKLRYITPIVFLLIAVVGCILSNKCPYAYSDTNLTTFKQSESKIADKMMSETFRKTNTVAIMVPSGDYAKEKALLEEYENCDEVYSVKGLANVEAMDGYAVADFLKPRQFAELTDMDIETIRLLYSAYAVDSENYGKIVGGIDDYGVPLIDMFDFLYKEINEGYFSVGDKQTDIDEIHDKLEDGKKQLLGEHYSRFVMELDLPEESDETFEFLDTIKKIANKYYPENVYLAGNSTNDRDLSSTFAQDNILISILSVIFVMVILLFTFQSAGIPIILILVIQGSIWINFSFPTIHNSPLFFLSYLVVSSIQMGANIDYAIVITNRYVNLRQEKSAKEAAIEAINFAFPTILTSGLILAASGITIGFLSSDATISSIGVCLGRGTIISIFLVMCILPQLLILGDYIIEKTSFVVKSPVKNHSANGRTYVDGHIRGYVKGRIDGEFKGTVNGDIDINMVSGNAEEK